MILAIDFDSTIVVQTGDYADTTTPLQFLPGAREGLLALKRAGHTLVLWSGRANRSLMFLPEFDPLVRVGLRRLSESSRQVNADRYRQMLAFVEAELPGVFDAVDDGRCGKIAADLYFDDKAVRVGRGKLAMSWAEIAQVYGEPGGEELFQRSRR